MTIRILFKGFTQELPPPERVALLARAFNGDRAKAEEALITPNYVLRTVASQAEVGLILPRLEKMGLRCEVVEGAEVASGVYQAHEVATRMATCQFCGYEQPAAKTCRKCGASFAAVRKINWKPAVELEPRDEDIPVEEPSLWDHLQHSGVFSTRNLVIALAIVALLAGFGFIAMPGQKPKVNPAKLQQMGITEEAFASMSSSEVDTLLSQNPELLQGVDQEKKNAVLMVMKGIVTSDPDKVKETATYNPESGENPYAKRLESLGIDQKEFSEAAAGIEAPIEGADVQGIIDENPMLKNAIDDAVNSSATSAGSTETDQMIDAIE